MDDELLETTCSSRPEFDRAIRWLARVGATHRQIDPTPALARVAVPALVVTSETRARLTEPRRR